MTRNYKSILSFCFIILTNIIFPSQSWGASQSFVVDVPKTAYLQWLSVPGAQMTNTNSSVTSIELYGTGGQNSQQDLYLGIMCNSLSGYQISLVATDSLGGAHAKATGMNESINYHVVVTAVSSTLNGASVSISSPDLTGSSYTISASFSSESTLPLKAHRPNVFQIKAVSDDPVPLNQSFHGGITAVITLP